RPAGSRRRRDGVRKSGIEGERVVEDAERGEGLRKEARPRVERALRRRKPEVDRSGARAADERGGERGVVGGGEDRGGVDAAPCEVRDDARRTRDGCEEAEAK